MPSAVQTPVNNWEDSCWFSYL